MKSVRKKVFLLGVILIIGICLTGCTKEVTKDSSNYAMVSYNEECVNIYSPISCTIELAITVEYSGKTITIGKSIEMKEHENRTATLNEQDFELFDETLEIVSVEVIKQSYTDLTVGKYCVAIFLFAIIIAILVWVFKILWGYIKMFLSFLPF